MFSVSGLTKEKNKLITRTETSKTCLPEQQFWVREGHARTNTYFCQKLTFLNPINKSERTCSVVIVCVCVYRAAIEDALVRRKRRRLVPFYNSLFIGCDFDSFFWFTNNRHKIAFKLVWKKPKKNINLMGNIGGKKSIEEWDQSTCCHANELYHRNGLSRSLPSTADFNWVCVCVYECVGETRFSVCLCRSPGWSRWQT